MIVVDGYLIKEFKADLDSCLSFAYDEMERSEEGSALHGSWARVAACIEQANSEFDE